MESVRNGRDAHELCERQPHDSLSRRGAARQSERVVISHVLLFCASAGDGGRVNDVVRRSVTSEETKAHTRRRRGVVEFPKHPLFCRKNTSTVYSYICYVH